MRIQIDSQLEEELKQLKNDITSEEAYKKELFERAKNKDKFSVQEQIDYMKYKGIKFDFVSEENAKGFLSNNTYYYKATAFRKNFQKVNDEYVNLDFGGLNEIATIDMYLRYTSIQITLDIEHALKARLVNIITADHTEDGYSIIQEFDDYLKNKLIETKENFKPYKYKKIAKSIMLRSNQEDSYHFEMFEKRKDNPPIWVLIELMSYGELIRFIEFYYEKDKFNKKRFELAYILLKYTSNYRNAAAHSRPLLLNITNMGELVPNELVTKYSSESNIDKLVRKERLSNKKIHDFVCILILHHTYIESEAMRKNRKKQLEWLVTRTLLRKEYFNNDLDMRVIQDVFSKIVDNYS